MECSRQSELHSESIMDKLAVKEPIPPEIGCNTHVPILTAIIISFYIVTHLYFYVKGLNSDKAEKCLAEGQAAEVEPLHMR